MAYDTGISALPFYKMDSNDEFSPSISISYKKTAHRLYWVKAGVELYFPAQTPIGEPFLVITTIHKGDNCKYYTRKLSTDSLKFEQWIYLEKLYLTPEVRSLSDHLSVYVWNPGIATFYFRNLKAEVYDY